MASVAHALGRDGSLGRDSTATWGATGLRFRLVAALLLVPSCLLLPQTVRPLVFVLLGLASAVAVLVGLRRHRPARPAPWVLVGGGLSLLFVGNVLYSVYSYSGSAVPFPSWADAVYLTAYPVLAAGLLVAVRRTPARDLVAWQDAATWVVGAALLSWQWLLEPIVEGPGTPLTKAAAAAGPVSDVVLLLLLVRLLGSRRGSSGVYRALVLALGCYLVSDVLYGLQSLSGTFEAGGYVDLGWLAAYAGIAATALHPRMVELCEPRQERESPTSRWRLLSLVAVAVVAPGAAALHDQAIGDGDDTVMLLLGGGVLMLLTALRGAGLLAAMDRLTAQLCRREAELERRASHDVLTGLANRSVLQERLERDLSGTGPVSVAIVDLDDFKHVNDASGHEVGDALLVAVSVSLARAMRPDELVVRLGGDEFAVVSSDPSRELGDRIVAALADCRTPDGRDRVSASTGVVSRVAGTGTTSDLLRWADTAMYVAKQGGGGTAAVYEPSMSRDLLARLDLRRELAAAVTQEAFVPWLQPVVDLVDGRLLGFEALARWQREGGEESPASWLAAAEDSELIVQIDAMVLRAAVRHVVAWAAASPDRAGLYLAVNASGLSLQQPGLVPGVLQVLSQEGLDPSRLLLEVTEGVLLDDTVGGRLQRLRAAGVRIALDDFGTGWSSLAYLRRFPVDVLKIDRSFVAGLGTGSSAEALPAAILQLASALRLDVVAEGVETLAQAKELSSLGCRAGQGFLLGRPLPAADLPAVSVAADVRVGATLTG